MRRTISDAFKRKRRQGVPSQASTSSDASQSLHAPPTAIQKSPESITMIPPTHDSPTNTESVRSQIWNEAYDQVKADGPKMVEAYEKILSVHFSMDRSSPFVHENTVNDIKPNAEGRPQQMKKMIEKGLEWTENGVKLKDTIKGRIKLLNTANDIVSLVAKSEPTAALAWAGIITCLGFVNNAMSEPSTNRDGMKYVCDRLEWYWELTQLLLDSDNNGNKSITEFQGLLRTHILGLYKKLLLYQVQSVCLYSEHWAKVILKDFFKVDDWQDKIDAIKNAEITLREDIHQYGSEVVKLRLKSFDDKLGDVIQAVEMQTKTMQQIDLDEKDNECLRDLCVIDPKAQKTVIEKAKGGLLKESYHWILEHNDFHKFRSNQDNHLLWIKGAPGKGKTMLLCGIIDELNKERQVTSYFFCQATENRLRSATSVIRSLIWFLCKKQPKLVSYVRQKYDKQGESVFEDTPMGLVSLEEILHDILSDECMQDAFLIVDALDECSEKSRDQLIDLIIRLSDRDEFRAKWIVSSRNWPSIEEQFKQAQHVSVQLELNEDSISLAVGAFIRYKVNQLANSKGYKEELIRTLYEKLLEKAQDTFLWVALVCQDLGKAKPRHVIRVLNDMPKGLDQLYERMLKQIFQSGDAPICQQILAITSIVKRPVTLGEIRTLIADLEEFEENELKEILGECGSFLTLQGDTIIFVHQSANDFLIKQSDPSETAGHHKTIFRRSMDALQKLKRDLYDLQSPGILIGDVVVPRPNPLAHLRYSCAYWVDHLEEYKNIICLSDKKLVEKFLREKFLYWLEALSLQGMVAQGVKTIRKLDLILEYAGADEYLNKLAKDAQRFILYHKHAIESAPLQVYASALIFSPTGSLIRQLFEKEEPDWISLKPKTQSNWDARIQTLEGHSSWVNSVAFSPDGQWLASASNDETVKIWDVSSAHCIRSLEIGKKVEAVVFLADSRQIVVSAEGVIQFWDTEKSLCIEQLPHQKDRMYYIALSPDEKMLASATYCAISMWNLARTQTPTQLVWQVSEESGKVDDISFSSDGQHLASVSGKGVITVWSTVAGSRLWAAEQKGFMVRSHSVTFLADNELATCGYHQPIRIWDRINGTCVQTIDSNDNRRIVYLGHGRCFASRSTEGRIDVWDDKGTCTQILRGLSYPAFSLAFSPSRQLLASGSSNHTIQILDLTNVAGNQISEENTRSISQMVLSPDGQWLFTLSSSNGVIKMRDTSNGTCVRTFEIRKSVHLVHITPDNRYLVAKGYREISIWDLADGRCIQTFGDLMFSVTFGNPPFSGTSEYGGVAFSPDSRLLAMKSDDSTVHIWDMNEQVNVQTIKEYTTCLALSNSSYRLVLGSLNTIKVWDPLGGHHLKTVQISHSPRSIIISKDSRWAVTMEDVDYTLQAAVRVWDLSTGTLHHAMRCSLENGCAFLSNPDRLAFSEKNHITVWDLNTKILTHQLDVPFTKRPIRADDMNTSHLFTGVGILDFEQIPSINSDSQVTIHQVKYHGHGISKDGVWILRGSERVLRLPAGYWAPGSFVMGSLAAFITDSGHWKLIRFR